MSRHDYEESNPRYWSAGPAEGLFRRYFHRKWTQRLAKLLVVILIFVTLGIIGAKTMQAATGATATPLSGPHTTERRSMCNYEVGTPCANKAIRWDVARFKEGKMGRISGIKPARFFARPAVARSTFLPKIRTAAARYYGRDAAGHIKWPKGQSAATAWDGTMHKSTCTIGKRFTPYRTSKQMCTFAGPGGGLTKKQVQDTGAVMFCAGGVAIAAASGVGWFVIGFGAAACGWSMWMASDPG